MRTFLAASATARTDAQSANAAFALPAIPSVLDGLILPALPFTAEEIAANKAKAARAAKAKPVRSSSAKAQHACLCSRFTAENGDSTGECDATTARKFAPGHDAKLKAMLVRAEVAGLKVAEGAVLRSAVETAELFGFAHLVAEGAAKVLAKKAAAALRFASK